jgi:hypothetical protein
MKDLFTAAEHFRYFTEFCANVQALGGATPHLTMVGESCRQRPLEEILWRGGCYATMYNYAAAEAIWSQWQPESILFRAAAFQNWTQQHWKGLPLRKERKAVNNPKRLAECVISFCQWLDNYAEFENQILHIDNPRDRYERAWQLFDAAVRYMGRYIMIRFFEYLKRYANFPLLMPDIRPVGGPFPRQALALMYPGWSTELLGNDRMDNCQMANRAANDCIARLADSGVQMDHYTLQSLLCEYKQSALGGRQYPGRSVDSELAYMARAGAYWGTDFGRKSEIWVTRRRIFPACVLGEIQGWAGPRAVLGMVLRNYRYTWTDVVYDYVRTQDFSQPARRAS